MAVNLSQILEVLAPFRSSCGLSWVAWGFDGSIVECHPPGDAYSVDYGLGLDEPIVTIDAP